MIRISKLVLITLATILIGSTSSTSAQSAATGDPCRELEISLAGLLPGTMIKFEMIDGREIEGGYGGLHDGALDLLMTEGITSLACDEVSAVWTDHRRFWTGCYKGGMLGLSVGMGITSVAAMLDEDNILVIYGVPILTVLSSLVGGGIGAMVHHWKPVYPPDSGSAREPEQLERRVGTIALQLGFGNLVGDYEPVGGIGGVVSLRAWTGRIISFGPEIGLFDLGKKPNDEFQVFPGHMREGWGTAQLHFSTRGQKVRIYSTGGTGLYIGEKTGIGFNAGGGLSYAAAKALTLLGEFRFHTIPDDEFDFITVTVGADFNW
ncbi:MAG: hypothetical protein ABIF77_03635 [bacterium]